MAVYMVFRSFITVKPDRGSLVPVPEGSAPGQSGCRGFNMPEDTHTCAGFKLFKPCLYWILDAAKSYGYIPSGLFVAGSGRVL